MTGATPYLYPIPTTAGLAFVIGSYTLALARWNTFMVVCLSNLLMNTFLEISDAAVRF